MDGWIVDTCLICDTDLTPTEILAGELWCTECRAGMEAGKAPKQPQKRQRAKRITRLYEQAERETQHHWEIFGDG